MKIGDVSKVTGLSAHTIRFYEKQGLIHKPKKDEAGHRDYSSRDIELINWISCLKKSAMPLNKIKIYVAAFESENSAIAQSILEEHLVKLKLQKRDINHYIQVTSYKIAKLKGLT